MIAVIWFLICVATLALCLLAAGLYLKAQNRERQDVVYGRLSVHNAENDLQQPAGRAQSRYSVIRGLQKRLFQAGFEPSEQVIGFWLLALAVTGGLLMLALGLLLGALVFGSGLIIVHLVLMQRANQRYRRLSMQLPDFMDRLLRPLIAGNTIDESFAIATRESPEPIRGLFLGVARQVRFGAPMEEALAQFASLHDLPDLHALAMATRVHRRYGGSIRKMVKSLIHMARSRETSAQELRALTAETRMSAWVLVAVPLVITSFILLRNPEYYSAMWSTFTGRGVLLAGFAMQFLGAVVIWRMMRSTAEMGT